VVKIATFAKPQNVVPHCKKPTAQTAHLVLPLFTKPTLRKTKRAIFAHSQFTISVKLKLTLST
jgi:hypothetical protein